MLTQEIKRVVDAEQVRYRKQIRIVKKKCKELKIKPETDIRIYIDYPLGWHGVFGYNNRVYIFTMIKKNISVTTEPLIGFYPNGALIRKERNV